MERLIDRLLSHRISSSTSSSFSSSHQSHPITSTSTSYDDDEYPEEEPEIEIEARDDDDDDDDKEDLNRVDDDVLNRKKQDMSKGKSSTTTGCDVIVSRDQTHAMAFALIESVKYMCEVHVICDLM